MNTASRMESTGAPNKIQVSADFARQLENAGKSHWVTPRTDLIDVKGKGEMQTYWLDFRGTATTINSSETGGDEYGDFTISDDLLV